MALFLGKLYKEHDLILVIDMKQRGAGSHLNAKHCLFICTLYQFTFIHDQSNASTSHSVSSIPDGVVVEFFKVLPCLNFDMFMIFDMCMITIHVSTGMSFENITYSNRPHSVPQLTRH